MLALALAVVTGTTVGLAAASSDLLVVAIAAGAVAVVTVSYPRTGLMIALAVSMLQYGPTKAYVLVPSSFTVLDDALLLALLARWSVEAAVKRDRLPMAYLVAVAAWVSIAGLVVLLARLDPETSARGLRDVLMPSLFLPIAFAYAVDRKAVRQVVRLVLGICVLHGIVAVVQAASASAIGDTSYGLLGPGGANALGFVLLYGCALSIGLVQWNSKLLAVVALLSTAIVAAAARGAMLTWPIVVGLTARGTARHRFALIAALVAVVALFGLFRTYVRDADTATATNLSLSYLWRSQNVPEWGGRAAYITALPKVLSDAPGWWLAGAGPGQYTSNTGFATGAPAYVSVRSASVVSPTGFSYPDGQWTAVTGEYGLGGLAICGILLCYPVLLARRLLHTDCSSDPYMRSVLRAMPGALCATLIGGLVLNILEYAPAASVWWTLCGIVFGMWSSHGRTRRDGRCPDVVVR